MCTETILHHAMIILQKISLNFPVFLIYFTCKNISKEFDIPEQNEEYKERNSERYWRNEES